MEMQQAQSSAAQDPQQAALKALERGALVLMEDVPGAAHIAIDCFSGRTQGTFKGFKMVPEGIHFVYYRCL